MKITHICLCGPVTDNFSYQDNLLPKFHKELGYEVSVITSKFIWNDKGELDIDPRDIYYNENEIKTIRLKTATNKNSKFKRYKGLRSTLFMENPDILFIHGVQFIDIKEIVKYLKDKRKIRVYVDNHADFSNSAKNWFSRKILHQIIWKRCAKLIEPYTNKFYGVLPARVDFLKEIYDLPEDKVDLLVMGADDYEVQRVTESNVRQIIRHRHGISDNDFLIVTGGKIDAFKKQTILLMKAIRKINNPNIKLLVFGSVSKELREDLQDLCDGKLVQYIGWLNSSKSYDFFSAANLVVFPGRHSVFWEQVVGMGIPIVCKYWSGTTHIDLGGNVEYLYLDSSDEIESKLLDIYFDSKKYEKMLNVSRDKGIKLFSYKEIAKYAIDFQIDSEY